jgi:glyoxylase-like metal-dependent hydrolase (beta-lactamase superfamily II)
MAKLRLVTVPVTPFEQNCALLWEESSHRGAVIDPGGDAPRILQAVREHGVTVERILLTHGHLDHAGGAAELQRLLAGAGQQDVPIVGPDRRDRFLLDGIAEQARAYGIPGLDNATPDRWLTEGEQVEIGGIRFDVLHCPGHTPGHVVFIAPSLRLAVLGDVLFRGSIGRTDFPYGDHAALLRAIAGKVLPLGDDVRFLCGHGPGSTLGEERRNNPFLADLASATGPSHNA